MSLYHEAAKVLITATEQGGSLKSMVFGKKDWKTDRKTLFALSTEAAKWSEVLSEVVEKSDLLKLEKQLTPVLALVLTHDLLLSKRGVALPAKHGLHSTISRHKARLTSELTKARLRRGCASLEALREQVNSGVSASQSTGTGYVHPRWIRINTLLTTLGKELETTFSEYKEVSSLSKITTPNSIGKDKLIYLDPNVPDLVAVSGAQDLSNSAAYKTGRLIFQEKASCFPASLLDPATVQGDIIDACAAPGNKTTHLAALLGKVSGGRPRKIYAGEKDAARSETLTKMIKLAGASDVVRVRSKQDFLKLDPHASTFANVEALLLDPSCSGSGIVGRDEASVKIHLPSRDGGKQQEETRGKKRKRSQQTAEVKLDTATENDTTAEEAPPSTTMTEDASKLASRLANLSSFQLRLLERAMAFPSAKRITYSTCSLHKEENEHVVARALLSGIARDRGWIVLRREEQVEGMQSWQLRGNPEAVAEIVGEGELEVDVEEVAEACSRCEKGGEGGTMGFFVVGFVRDGPSGEANGKSGGSGDRPEANGNQDSDDEDEEWEGFSGSES